MKKKLCPSITKEIIKLVTAMNLTMMTPFINRKKKIPNPHQMKVGIFFKIRG